MSLIHLPIAEVPSEALAERTLRHTMAVEEKGPLRLALAGGGTGGHIVPGLNLLRHLRGTSALGDVLWFQSGRSVEKAALANFEASLRPTPAARVQLQLEPPGGGAPSTVQLAKRLWPEVRRARAALHEHRTQVLLGLGGFTALPPALAALSLRIPVALFEINALPGRATRFLGPIATRVFHAWRTSLPDPLERTGSRRSRHRWTGPPLGTAFLNPVVSPEEERVACLAQGLDPARPVLFVLGGSQGAMTLNRFVRAWRHVFLEAGVQILHQVGPDRAAEAAEPVDGYRPVEFIDDVRGALLASTMVLCRGGASTIAEVGALRKPAWVVPYPHHKDHHQQHNAMQLGPGIRIVVEGELGETHARELAALCGPGGHGERLRMTQAMSGLVPPDCAVKLCEELLALRR